MSREEQEHTASQSPWVRVFVALVSLGIGAYGIIIAIRGRLVSEGVVLEGGSARIVGVVMAVLAVVSLCRTLISTGKRQ